MQVNVRVSGQLRAALGAASIELTIGAGSSAADAVRQLADGRDAAVRAALLRDDGEIQPTLVIAVGSDQVADAATLALQEGDTVTILPPISGG
jgi:molybdopterin converting factor small subunit